MTAKTSQRTVRATQIGFIVLLLACSAQLAYWMADGYRYTETVRDHRRAAYEEQARSSAALLRAGVPWSQIRASQTEIDLGPDGVPRVSAAMLAQLDADRFHRLNRYAWEGSFFLLVLIAAMAVVYAALREEHSLRRQQEDFLAAASHELKSPLASLRLSAETIAMRDPAPPHRAELVQRLLSDIGRLDQMIANVLDASRLSRESVRVSREPVDLRPLFASVADELRPLADDCGVRVLLIVDDGLTVDADREGVRTHPALQRAGDSGRDHHRWRLRRRDAIGTHPPALDHAHRHAAARRSSVGVRTIARNLIHNGIKASRPSAGTVIVRGAQDAQGVTIHVDDTGIGFAIDEARGLFQKFHRIEANGSERLPGTGLGLFLVRRCAEMDGAVVTASSDGPGHGARFEVRWPASRTAASES